MLGIARLTIKVSVIRIDFSKRRHLDWCSRAAGTIILGDWVGKGARLGIPHVFAAVKLDSVGRDATRGSHVIAGLHVITGSLSTPTPCGPIHSRLQIST
jgi:hypothetical protein